MNGKDLLIAMSFVDEKYVHEADVKYPKKKHFSAFKKYGSLAACFAIIVVVAGLIYNSETSISPMPIPPISPVVDNSGELDSTLPSSFIFSMENVHINDAIQPVEASLWYDPELYDFVKWGAADISNYFGSELIPAYIPKGLNASENNTTATVITDKQGIIVNDVVRQSYFDYSVPIDSNLYSGFTLSASKLGLIRDYKYDNDGIQATEIEKTEVIFGYCSMPIGTSEAHYDLYTAEFMLGDIEYQLTAYQMQLDDFVKIVVSVIINDANIEISK